MPSERPEPQAGRWALRGLAATLGLLALTQFATGPEPLPARAAPEAIAGARVIATADRPIALAGIEPGRVHSLLNLSGRLNLGEWRWDETGVPAGPLWVRVDRASQLVSVFRGPHEIGTAAIVYGAPEKPTPAGRYPIRGKALMHVSRSYGAEMPYTLWLTGDGVALHASPMRPGGATHGCVGLPELFARRLFDAAAAGDTVVIV